MENTQTFPRSRQASASPRIRHAAYSLVRGRAEDPPWVRPVLIGLLGTTGLLYLWNLAASGWANAYYSAAVLAGTRSWAAFFFGSLDASNFITVDKAPAALWVMEISARLFRLQRLERARAAGTGRRRDGCDRLSRRPPLLWAGCWAPRRRGRRADPGCRPDVPIQQPRCIAGATHYRSHLRHAPRHRKWPDALAGAGRRANWVRIPGQGTAGLHHHPGPGRRLSHRRSAVDRPPHRPGARRRGRRDRELGLVGRRGRADAERIATLHRRLAEQRPDQLDLRIQRFRPADGQRVGECRRLRRPRLTLGIDRLGSPLQQPARWADLVADRRGDHPARRVAAADLPPSDDRHRSRGLPYLGRESAADRRGPQLRPGNHPSLLHGRAGSRDWRAGWHGRRLPLAAAF